ncbi:MAG: YjjG family noncanonical pyrimidine nucleotidase [Natronincolaceae bacterium]|jgi:2-haloacid dehalogenase|nr:YjjG family noncanonical pyrimidine nucleotidase [Bacillota bacterium]NLK90363.1 noncanonical pyrimidine nucleotidase, YjjG family [Clostridiales bacterium]
MIKNILFDLDNTLLDFHLAERIALTKTLLHLGIEPKEEILARYSEINSAQWKLLELGELTREEVRVRRYKLLFEEIGVNRCAGSATRYYENLLGIGHYFISGAEELLKTLSDNYRLYLVSNGLTAVQKPRIESACMARYFEDIFISQSIGFNKPSIEFFNYCFKKIPEFKNEETMIVGDSLTSDIKGGRDAGITTVWFNPEGAENLSDIIPDYEIDRLLDLLSLLETI